MTEEPPRRTRGRLPPRPSPRKLSELPFLLVLGGVVIGLAVVALHHFKRGSIVISVALLLGAVLRSLLPEERAGLLAVRGRVFDVATMVTLGVLITVAALIVPPP